MEISDYLIYKILFHFKNLKIRVQESLIFDGTDIKAIYIRNDLEGNLKFTKVEEYQAVLIS